MHGMIDGKLVIYSPEQERQIREDWVRNEAASAEEAERNPQPAPDDPPQDLEAEITDLRARLEKLEGVRR